VGTGCPNVGCDTIADALDADGVAISLDWRPFDASDISTRDLDGWQFVLGEGPMILATSNDAVVEVPDVASDGVLWPRFSERLATHSIGSMFAFPITFDHTAVGALSVYRSTPSELSTEQHHRARSAAETAGLLIGAHILAERSDHKPTCGLHRLDRLNQAIGIVVYQLGVQPDEAMVRLRAHAYVHDRSLDTVVDDLVNRGLRLNMD
jgi:hypothetical protein